MSVNHAGLRAWAKGLYPLEASVELLVGFAGGRFATPGHPWIRPGTQPGRWWLDPSRITPDTIGALSGGEQRMLRIVASLAGGGPVDLSENLSGLDRPAIGLVLAAVAHAAGSHEHADVRIDHERGVSVLHGRLPSLYPWPSEGDPHDHDESVDGGVPARPAGPAAVAGGTVGRDRAGRPRRGVTL